MRSMIFLLLLCFCYAQSIYSMHYFRRAAELAGLVASSSGDTFPEDQSWQVLERGDCSDREESPLSYAQVCASNTPSAVVVIDDQQVTKKQKKKRKPQAILSSEQEELTSEEQWLLRLQAEKAKRPNGHVKAFKNERQKLACIKRDASA